MDRNYQEILSEFTEEEQRILCGYINVLFEYKTQEDWAVKTKDKFQEIVKELKTFEESAKRKIKERKNNPICSFCNKKSSEVEKLFNKNEHLNICSDCVKQCYEQL